MVDGESVIDAASEVDIYGVVHLFGREANEDVGGGLHLDLSQMCRELGLSQVILRTTYVTSREDILRAIQ